MAVNRTYLKGNDISFDILAKNASGVVIPISAIYDYEVFIYGIVNSEKRLFLVFAKNSDAEKRAIVVVDDAAGRLKIIIPRTWTVNAPEALLIAEIRCQFTASADYVSSKVNKGLDNLVIGNLKSSASGSYFD